MESNTIKDENSKEKVKQSQAAQILSLIESSEITFFHDEYDEPYARFRHDNHYKISKIKSSDFKRWISHKAWSILGLPPNSEALNSALQTIGGICCFEGSKYELVNRIAYCENSIFYDLGDWKAVKIDNKGWEVELNPPILFRSFNHQKPQAIPEKCKPGDEKINLENLLFLINIKDENQKFLFLINLISMFLPHIPRPIFVLHGDQGTAKSTTSTMIKELVDPSMLKTLRIGNSYQEFIQQASHHYILGLDNLTSLPTWMSDALCRLVTGEGFSKRELYTNDDDIIYSFKRCITLNGINLVPNKPDLLDRCLIFELETIPQSDRIEERVFWEQFEEIKPQVLGAIFSTLSKAMTIYPNIRLQSRYRMADFTQWGAAISEALGYSKEDFLNAYKANIAMQNTEALEANSLGKVIINFMSNKSEWTGNATDLYNELADVAESLMIDRKDRRYPTDPRWLWRRLKEIRPNLASEGIHIGRDETDRTAGRIIKITNSNPRNTLKTSNYDVIDVMMSTDGQNDINDINLLDLSDEEQDRIIAEYIDKDDYNGGPNVLKK